MKSQLLVVNRGRGAGDRSGGGVWEGRKDVEVGRALFWVAGHQGLGSLSPVQPGKSPPSLCLCVPTCRTRRLHMNKCESLPRFHSALELDG